jgi:hypothetical protein
MKKKRVTESCFERRKLGNPWRQHKLAGLMLCGGDPVSAERTWEVTSNRIVRVDTKVEGFSV